MCDAYVRQDARVRVIHQKNKGLFAARNAGISASMRSESQWFFFVDSDDWVHKNCLKYLYEAITSSDADIAICGFAKTNGEQPPCTPCDFKEISIETLWRQNTMNAAVAWCKLYKKSIFKKVRYPNGRYFEDEFVTYRLLFSENRIVYSPMPLYYYFQNPKGIMNSPWNPQKLDAIDALNQQVFFFRNHGYAQFAEIRWRFLCRRIEENRLMLEQRGESKGVWRRWRKMVRAVYRKNMEFHDAPMEKKEEWLRLAFPIRSKLDRRFLEKALNKKEG